MLYKNYGCGGCSFSPNMELNECKLHVSVMCLHGNAKSYEELPFHSWKILAEYLWYSKLGMVIRVVDRQNCTSFLPQEMSGTHSMLNLLIPKIDWLTHGSPFFLLSKCSPTLIICPGEVNMWAPSKSCQAWVSIVILWLPIWAFYITEEEVWRTGQIAWRGFCCFTQM